MNASTIKVSHREAEILNLMSDGLTSKEIGRELYISSLTVDKHKRNMLTKFNARNSVQLVLHADRMGLLSHENSFEGVATTDDENSQYINQGWTDVASTTMPL